MLDERKAAILRAVVQEYIETAQPVGSGHVARKPGLDVSPATVRNELAILEREGYVVQPHTSAGRIPTDKGYRFFVDHLTRPGALGPAQRQKVREFFASTHGALERMLHDTSQLLSSLTNYAAVVVGPPHEAATIRSVQLVSLAPRLALLVLVLSSGAVEHYSVDLAEEVGEERIAAVSTHLGSHLTGRAVASSMEPPPSGDPAIDSVAQAAVRAIATAPEGDQGVYVGGASRMAAAFEAVDTVRQVLATLEQQYVVVGLLRGILDQGLSVAIGAEHGFEPLAECSVVVAPYEVEGDLQGTVGVVGPTRMKYPQALAAVAVVSERLSRRLSEG